MADINYLGEFATIAAVWSAYPEGGKEGDWLIVDGVKYRWNKYDRIWENSLTVTSSPARRVTSFYGDVHVHNDLVVGGTLKAKHVKQPNLGLYPSVEVLESVHPNPEVGQWAVVGDTLPGDMYRCDVAGVWSATGEVGGLDDVDLEDYVRHADVETEAVIAGEVHAHLYVASSSAPGGTVPTRSVYNAGEGNPFRIVAYRVGPLIREGDTLELEIANNQGSCFAVAWFFDDIDWPTTVGGNSTAIGDSAGIGNGESSNGIHDLVVPEGAQWLLVSLHNSGSCELTDTTTDRFAVIEQAVGELDTALEALDDRVGDFEEDVNAIIYKDVDITSDAEIKQYMYVHYDTGQTYLEYLYSNYKVAVWRVNSGDTLGLTVDGNISSADGSVLGGCWLTDEEPSWPGADDDPLSAQLADVPNVKNYAGAHTLQVPAGAKWFCLTFMSNSYSLVRKSVPLKEIVETAVDTIDIIENKTEDSSKTFWAFTAENIQTVTEEEGGQTVETDNCFWSGDAVGKTIGQDATKVMVTGVSYRCIKPIPVKAGDRVSVYTFSNANMGRAWALTDSMRKIVKIADDHYNGRVTPQTVTVSADGYLFVNNNQKNAKLEDGAIMASVTHGTFAMTDDVYAKQEVDALLGDVSKQECRILVAGNSYAIDALTYLPQLMAVHHPEIKLKLTLMYAGGVGLKYYKNDASKNEVYSYDNGVWGYYDKKFLADMLNEEWDIIVFHQSPEEADDYGTRIDNGTDCLDYLIEKCLDSGHEGRFGWMMTVAFSTQQNTYISSNGYKGDPMMDGITDFAQQVMENYDVSVLLPCGLAVHNARHWPSSTFSDINNEFFHTDNLHIQTGIGCYIEAYAAMVALFGDGQLPGHTFKSGDLVYYPSNYPHGTEVGITIEKQLAGRKCAIEAVDDPFKKFTT